MRSFFATTTLALLITFGAGTAAAQDGDGEERVTDDITADVTWTSDTVYFLDGLVFVNEGATLTIEAGTVVKGIAQGDITTNEGASALIIRRGAQINAVGAADNPIIFTAAIDDTDDATDTEPTDRGLWGGVILLGEAPTNQAQTLTQIEGIPNDLEAQYGGDDPEDNSGTMQYVSIRHGGFSISGVAGDEINGLTMGAVGSGTTIDHVEIYANLDDGFEWFGGTVSTSYLVAAYCGDDSFDYDQGYRGNGQFWFSIQAPDIAGRAAEFDGVGPSSGAITEDPPTFSQVTLSNATLIGAGQFSTPTNEEANDNAFRIREGAGALVYNSVVTGFVGGVIQLDTDDVTPSSNDRLVAGDLAFVNNVFSQFGAGVDATEFPSLISTEADVESALATEFSEDNQLAPVVFQGLDRAAGGDVDPRLAGSTADIDAEGFGDDEALSDEFFEEVDFIGAFGDDLWIEGWTAVAEVEVVTGVEQVSQEVPETITLGQNYPNPFNPTTTIEYQLEKAQNVRLAVYDVLGRQVALLADGVQPAGTFHADFDASNLASGMYLYKLETESSTLTRMMTLLK